MTATDQLAAIQARAEGLTDLCAEHLRQSIRHVQRNCDLDCNIHEDENTWDDCKQPDRYDGDRMAAALADIPALLAMVRERDAALERVEELLVRKYELYGAICGNTCNKDIVGVDHDAIADEVAAAIRAAITATEGAK